MQLPTDWDIPMSPLAPYTLPHTVQDAIASLQALIDESAVLGCYAHFFPTAWAASTAAQSRPPDRAYAPAEWEFFRLVDRDLFALTLDWLAELDCQGPESRTLELPVLRGGLDWTDCGSGDLRAGWELLLRLKGDWTTDDDDEEDAEDTENEPHATPRPVALAQRVRALAGRPLDEPRLTAACATLDSPLRGLPAALLMIDHDTGTAWLDADLEQEMDLVWTITDVTWMQTDYAAGRVIADQADDLVEWLQTPAGARQLLDLWAACLATPEAGP